jgi:hypothetical protein
VKGYRLIDPSINHLIIERSVHFKEIFSHAPHETHASTFVLPPFQDDESAHLDFTLDMSSNIELDDSEHT